MSTWTSFSSMTEPDPEPEYGPADCYETCVHAEACRTQFERQRGWEREETFGWLDRMAECLGCSEDCECYEDTNMAPSRLSGTMRQEKRGELR